MTTGEKILALGVVGLVGFLLYKKFIEEGAGVAEDVKKGGGPGGTTQSQPRVTSGSANAANTSTVTGLPLATTVAAKPIADTATKTPVVQPAPRPGATGTPTPVGGRPSVVQTADGEWAS